MIDIIGNILNYSVPPFYFKTCMMYCFQYCIIQIWYYNAANYEEFLSWSSFAESSTESTLEKNIVHRNSQSHKTKNSLGLDGILGIILKKCISNLAQILTLPYFPWHWSFCKRLENYQPMQKTLNIFSHKALHNLKDFYAQ